MQVRIRRPMDLWQKVEEFILEGWSLSVASQEMTFKLKGKTGAPCATVLLVVCEHAQRFESSNVHFLSSGQTGQHYPLISDEGKGLWERSLFSVTSTGTQTTSEESELPPCRWGFPQQPDLSKYAHLSFFLKIDSPLDSFRNRSVLFKNILCNGWT